MSHIIRHTILGVDGKHDFGLKIGESRTVLVTEVKATEDGWELVYRLAPRADSEKVFTIAGVERVVNSTERRYWRVRLEEVDPANESGDAPVYWAFVPVEPHGDNRTRFEKWVSPFARDQLAAAAEHGGPVPAWLRMTQRKPLQTSRGPAEKLEWQGALDLGPTPIQLSAIRWTDPLPR